MPVISQKIVDVRQHQRHHRAQHQHDVDHRQHEDEVGDAHHRLVDEAAAIARQSRRPSAPMKSAPSVAASDNANRAARAVQEA